MPVAQGLYKTLAYKKQTALGTPATGAGAQLLRRETATFNKMTDTFDANEIVAHQQDTGVAFGISKMQGDINGVVSAASYAPLLASLCRTALTAGVTATGASLTIAGSAPTFTITRAAGSYLTDGFKIGDVVRITAGAFTGIATNLNLLVTGVTALVLSVIVPNGLVLFAQGPIITSTIGVVNKKAVVPATGQANDYYTFEEFFTDISRSRTFTDCQIGSAEISVPATGYASIKMAFMGLARTLNAAQQFTSPSAASNTGIISAENAKVFVAGANVAIATSAMIKIDAQLQFGDPVVGSVALADLIKGDLKVTGTLTHLKADETFATLFDGQGALQIIVALFTDATPLSDFVCLSIPYAKMTKDQIDDGKKQIVATHDFIAQYNGAGGAAVATDTGIISIQDSAI